MAAACLRYPFTAAQWQELERQALIFKYMMAAMPVPPDLLIPTTRGGLSNTASSPYASLGRGGSCFNLRFSNGADPEPGRCRRTDGKKWRCSRDVAPDQKYCERHMHRSRPRSRKHVEVQSEINTTTSTTNTPALSANSSSHHLGSSTPRPYPQPSMFLPKPDFKSLPVETMATTTASPYKDSRSMDWMQQQMMQGKGIPTRNSTPYQQHYQENSYNDFGTNFQGLDTQNQSDNCCLYLNQEFEPLSEQRQMPRRFIDAWSTARDTAGPNKSSASSTGKLSPSTLSLSMSSDNGGGDDIDQIPMGLGVIDSECENTSGSCKSQPLSWMTPASWIGSPPGGPLGEVLQSSSSIPNGIRNTGGSRGLNLMKDDWAGSRDTSPRGMTVSSPSGVLHKTLASPSDSSGGNSPTFKAGRSDIALQWMNHHK
ncbi:hypothetical protein ACHQM5_001580 [Ranunculus cassubicifolius]